MGSLVAFHVAHELNEVHPGMVSAVVFSGFASVPSPSAASPFGIKALFCLTKARASVARAPFTHTWMTHTGWSWPPQNERAVAAIGGFMARHQPHGPLAPVDVTQLTHVAAEVDFLRKDPKHINGQVLNRTGHEVMKMAKRAKALTPKFTLPFLALHGTDDTLTYPIGTEKLFRGSSAADKHVRYYPGLDHEILLEVERATVERDILEFFNARNSRAKAPTNAATPVGHRY
jgi:alpha-beta hydrolase superfamily lysophospholipase